MIENKLKVSRIETEEKVPEGRTIKIPEPVDTEVIKNFIDKIHNVMLTFRSPCAVCNLMTEEKDLREFILDEFPLILKEKIKKCCGSPEKRYHALLEKKARKSRRHVINEAKPDWVKAVPKVAKKYYSLGEEYAKYGFEECLLSKEGLCAQNGKPALRICSECLHHFEEEKGNAHPTPQELLALNEIEKQMLQKYFVFVLFNLHQRDRANNQIHSYSSIFAVGEPIAAKIFPHIPEADTSCLLVRFESGKYPTTLEKRFLITNYFADPIRLRAGFKWLGKNHSDYKNGQWDDEKLSCFMEKQNQMGCSVVQQVKMKQNVEVSTHIGPSISETTTNEKENEMDEDDAEENGCGNEKIEEEDEFEELVEISHNTHGSVYLFDSKKFKDVGNVSIDLARLQGITYKSSNIRAYGWEPGVLESTFFWLFPLGEGGFAVERQTALNEIDYFDGLFRRAEAQFDDPRLVAFAVEVIRFKQGSSNAYKIGHRGTETMLTSSEEEVAEFLQSKLKCLENQEENKESFSHSKKNLNRVVECLHQNMFGTEAAKATDRRNLISLVHKLGLPHLFFTFNPSNGESLLYYDQITGKTHSFPLPNDIKKVIASNPEGQVACFEKCIGALIEYGINGGLFGPVEGYFGVPETTAQGYLHSHWLIWLKDTTRGPSELNELMNISGSDVIEKQLCDFFQSIAVGAYPSYFDFSSQMECPVCHEKNMEEQELGPRFQMESEYHYSYPYVVKCKFCKAGVQGHIHIQTEIERILRHYNVIDENGTIIDHSFEESDLSDAWSTDTNFVEFSDYAEEERTMLEALGDKFPSNLELIDGRYDKIQPIPRKRKYTWKERKEYFELHRNKLLATAKLAQLFLDHQQHDFCHRDTCFKNNKHVCRSSYPKSKVASTLLKEFVELKRGTFSEYINCCNEAISRCFSCNNDIKLLFTKEKVGCLLVWYIVKYVTKKQDTFARTLIEGQIMKYVKRFTDSRSRHFQNYSLESLSFANSSDLPNEEKRNIGIRLACTLFNIFRIGEQLDVTYCLHFLKDRKEHWCSHTFVNVHVGDVVKKEIFHENPDESQLREDPFADKKERFVKDDKYLQYVYRPKGLEEMNFYEFTERYFMRHREGAKAQPSLTFQEGFPLSNYRCVKIKEEARRCVSIVGSRFPNHEDFHPNVFQVLGYDANTQNETNVSSNIASIDETFDEFENAMKDRNNEYHNDNDDDNDCLLTDRQNLFGLLACLMFVPFCGDISDLKDESESWYDCFIRLAPGLKEESRSILLSILESKTKADVRDRKREEWKHKEVEATADSTEAGKTPEDGWVPTRRRRNLQKTKNLNANLVKELCQFDEISRFSSTLQNSVGKWKMKYQVSKYLDKFWNVCEPTKGGKVVQDQFDEIVASYEQEEISISSKYVRREGQVLFELTAARDELVKEITKMFNLSETQELVFAIYCAHLDSSDLVRKIGDKFGKFVVKKSFRANLSGEGGTGKSRVIKAIREYARRIGRPQMVLCNAQFGSVASAMQGWTIASLLGQKYNGEEYDPSKNKELIENCNLLIIDEISLIDKRTWIKLNDLFKTVKGNKIFFGGVHLLLVGDCFQLPPVSWSGDGMIHVECKKCKPEVSQVTKEYLKQVEYAFILTEQWRMKDDAEMTEFARGFRRGRFEKRHEDFLQSHYKSVEEVDLGKSIVLVGSRKEKAA